MFCAISICIYFSSREANFLRNDFCTFTLKTTRITEAHSEDQKRVKACHVNCLKKTMVMGFGPPLDIDRSLIRRSPSE